MCEQCQAFEDDDQDALAAAFVARQAKGPVRSAPAKPAGHALLDRRAPAKQAG